MTPLPRFEGVGAVLQNPYASALVTIAVVLLVHRIRRVGPGKAMRLEKARTLLLPLLHRYVTDRRGYSLVADKTDSGEDILTFYEDLGLRELMEACWAEGIRWNPLSTKKYIVTERGRRSYAVMSLVYRPGNGQQYHYYVFRVDGSLMLYGHLEDSATDVDGHLEGGGEAAVIGPAMKRVLNRV